MHCTIGVVRTCVEGPDFLASPHRHWTWVCLKEFLDSGIGSDIVFEVADETFKAHKLILAARTPVFRAQFFGLIGYPNMEKVVVEDVEPPVFKVIFFSVLRDYISRVIVIFVPCFCCTLNVVYAAALFLFIFGKR
ncbi:BTB/POZ and MATH domain-containing protein 3 [Acorus gramineus]|uniref:BTB/POZ and MATH domain-containing protein 3 n=1 Tax=Acorus gramineus TaxID=55184 RepID=A0AAV9ALH8_ACOGR|nr:BTB/POZ and MATH domain-containing protein 3 [Acorus gramineus]